MKKPLENSGFGYICSDSAVAAPGAASFDTTFFSELVTAEITLVVDRGVSFEDIAGRLQVVRPWPKGR
jgi:hypothetical protein